MSTSSIEGEKVIKPFEPIGLAGTPETRIAHSLEHIATTMEQVNQRLNRLIEIAGREARKA